MRFATYNLMSYGKGQGRGSQEREARIRAVIQSLDADVVAVQELAAPESLGEDCLVALAEAVGMTAYVEAPWVDEDDGYAGKAAVGLGRHGLHVGLMWRAEGGQPVPGTLRAYDDFWHGLVKVTLALEAGDGAVVPVQCASYHATPFGLHMRADQAERMVSTLIRPAGRPPGLVGADWNCISAERRPDGSFYDEDWHVDQEWFDNLVFQCRPGPGNGHEIDREPGWVLHAGGLLDAAALLDAPWAPTAGHWPDDGFGARRIDGVRVTRDLATAVVAVETVRTDLALSASDHLPVVVTFSPERTAPARSAR